MVSSKVFPEQRERQVIDFEFKADRDALRAAMAKCSGDDGDYKDSIGAKSAQLFDLLQGNKSLLKQADKLGLLNGGSCPRATLRAWSAV